MSSSSNILTPTKTECIPIHTSDRATFKRCRRKWDWSSPMRRNLRQKVSQAGIYFPLWFGSGVHWALAQYYNPNLKRDPVEAFINWYTLQWEGGVVEEDMLEHLYDPNPRLFNQELHDGGQVMNGNLYEVLGLRDIHPDPIVEEFEAHRELGIGMLTFYRDVYAPANDNFTVIAEESSFSIPIGLTAIDPRDGEVKPVHYRGRRDAVVQDNESGRYGILEHKTAVSIAEEYFRKLEKDEQVTSYMYVSEVEAELYDLPYKQIDFTIYNGLRKAFPRPPTVTARAPYFSIDRQKESTTYEMLMQHIEENNLQLAIEGNEKVENYIEYLQEIGHDQFVVRKPVFRNRAEVTSCAERVRMEAMDMLGITPHGMQEPMIYPNPTGDWQCLNCIFRGPCIARDDGSDWEMMLDDNYEVNPTR